MDAEPFKHLKPSTNFVVFKEFKVYDGIIHPVGESWIYRGKSFLPHDDGLSLFIVVEGADHHIRMQWRDEEQGPIIDTLSDYVVVA